MNFCSIIKKTFFYGFFIIITSVFSQNNTDIIVDSDSIAKDNLSTTKRQRLGAFSFGYHKPIPTGNNFVGKGMKGISGLDFKFQLYVYRQFFLGGNIGSSYLEVEDSSVTGNYDKTTINEQYLYLGYEFLLFDDWRLGVMYSFIGDAIYKNNNFSGPSKGIQTDTASYKGYGLYINYELSDHFMFYFEYIYRNDKTRIKAPSEIQDFFERARFNNIGIGIKFTFGRRDLIS